ncbi:MAG: M3 family oligoendopeptidase [Oscillospiraceae bacterium]|nr:M3 family oligoendopeptidase [Oscillospiraceae bacterium]
MKFSEMPYVRPDLDALKEQTASILHRLETARSPQEQIDAYLQFEVQNKETDTACALAYARHTMNTKDPYYNAENTYLDEITPSLQEMSQKIQLALLRSPFRTDLEERFGKLFFTNLEIRVRTVSPKIRALMQDENRLQSEYQNLYASAMVEWRGRQIPLPKLLPFKESTNRTVRRAAYETEGRWFDGHQEQLDSLFDRLVRCRTEQGRALGYENYLPLGYDRMCRNCYGPAEVAAFREQTFREITPAAAKVKEAQRKRLGLDRLALYDDALRFPDGNAVPQGTADRILAAGREVYRELSPETEKFIGFLYDNELLDVLSRKGKAPGGYCSDFPLYQSPFIFANFSGTNDDVDTLTHEAGHAFAYYRSSRRHALSGQISPTMEACEVHSMSMEFLTAPWHEKFFGPLTQKYEIEHCENALSFLPYGCMVDEFQHLVYENPGLTPEQRNALWLDLEHKYRPWMDFGQLPFYSRGAGWQRQLHIYLCPLYYIDYCMAQTVAFQFWLASLRDPADAWARYLRFVDAGGTQTFAELVSGAGLQLPYAPGCIGETGAAVLEWLGLSD